MTSETNWISQAVCRGEDPELFFVSEKGEQNRAYIEDAKTICRGCEVRDRCLQYALDHGEEFGIWGGLTERERRAIKRRNNTTRNLGSAAL